jgi:Tfp pilus assembly protein PilO
MKTGLNAFKPKIGLTKREFALIALLLTAVMGYLLFTYLLQPVFNEYTAGKDRLEQSKAILANLKASYERKSEMENSLTEIEGKLHELTVQIPPYLSQEEVILLVDSLSQKDMLMVQLINFDNPGAVPSIAAPVPQTAVDAAGSNAEKAVPPAPSAAPTFINQDITLSFTGSYPQIYSFLTDVEKNLRKVAVKGISLQKNQEGQLTGQMKLSFVSYWDVDGQQPYTMEVPQIPGKDSPFTPYLGYSESAVKGSPVVKPVVQPDFTMMVNGYLNNADKVVLYQYPKADTTVSADDNGIIKANMTLNGSDSGFTYSYTVGKNTKTSQGSIKVRDGKIRLEVLVQKRSSEQDKIAVVLDVANNTSLPFEIAVSGDEPQNPRFRLGKTAGSIIVK